MVVVRIQLINENHLNVPFLYGLPSIEPAPGTLKESANLCLPWDSCMALSKVKKKGALSAGSHDTDDAVVADEWKRAAFISGEVHAAEQKVAEVDV